MEFSHCRVQGSGPENGTDIGVETALGICNYRDLPDSPCLSILVNDLPIMPFNTFNNTLNGLSI